MTAYPAVVIGCGFIGSRFNEGPSYDPRHTHAAAYSSHKETKLVGVCDTDAQRVKEAASHWKTESFIDPAKMLGDKNPVFVSIASPTETHAEMLKLAIETPSVKAILCEKPIAGNIDEGAAFVEKAKNKGIHLAVNYSRRFNVGHNKVKDLIASGALGDLKVIRALYQNGILHNGTHLIDLFRFIIGEIIAVRVAPDPAVSEKDSLSGILEFSSGVKGYLRGTDMPNITFGEIDLIGTKGRITTEQNGHVIKHFEVGPSPLFPTFRTFINGKNISEGLIDNTYHAVRDLLDCVEGKREQPRCTGPDAIRAMKVAFAMVESAKRGERVEVK